MNSYSIHYEFGQPFDVPAKMAYDWCVDYRPDDWERMGKKGTRKISRLNDDTLILTDTVTNEGGPVTKKRLVRLSPERLSWTNTHLAGPNKHSQFWYRISALGKGKSKLEFIGLQINYGKRPPPAEVAKMAEEIRADDKGMWVLLAEEMQKDLGK